MKKRYAVAIGLMMLVTSVLAAAMITVSPTSAVRGATDITITGSGFKASDDIDIVFNNIMIPCSSESGSGTKAVKADSSGDFWCKFTVPNVEPGTTLIKAMGIGGTDSATFLVQPIKYRISGYVTGSQDEKLSGMLVKLTGKSYEGATEPAKTFTSNNDGMFEFKNVNEGEHILTVSNSEYKPYDYDFNLDSDKRIDPIVYRLSEDEKQITQEKVVQQGNLSASPSTSPDSNSTGASWINCLGTFKLGDWDISILAVVVIIAFILIVIYYNNRGGGLPR